MLACTAQSALDAGTRTDGVHHLNSPPCTPTHASITAASESALVFHAAGCTAVDHYSRFSKPTVVVGRGESQSGFTLPFSSAHHSDHNGRLQERFGRTCSVLRSQSVVLLSLGRFRVQTLPHQPLGVAGNKADVVSHRTPTSDQVMRIVCDNTTAVSFLINR